MKRNSYLTIGLAIAGVAAYAASSVHAIKPAPAPRTGGAAVSSTGSPVEGRVAVGDTLFREKPVPPPVLTPAQAAQAAANARMQYALELPVRQTRMVRGDHGKKLVALTFDDGPHPGYTVQLLQTLKALHIKATFFLVGKQVDKYPSLVQMEALEGHELGNHTYDHVDLTQIPPELIGFELDECERAIRRATGSSARFFRPPGGQFAPVVVGEATKRHLVTALWSDDPGDYAKPGADVVLQRVMDHLGNGSIILLHDGIPDTISVLPTIVSEAHKRGFEFVTMSELARSCANDRQEATPHYAFAH